MPEPNHVQDFINAVSWSRYAGATFAYALCATEHTETYCMGCRIVLRFTPPAAKWDSDARLGDLQIKRGWLTQTEASALLSPSVEPALNFSDARVVLALPSAPGYHWSLQPFYSHVAAIIGRPALMLQGCGQSHHQVIGLDAMRSLGRKLPALRPHAFGGWEKLGVFLGGDGQPLRLDESGSALLEFAAPSAAFVNSSRISPSGDVTLSVHCDVPPRACGASLCYTPRGSGAAVVIDVANLPKSSLGGFSFCKNFDLGAFPVQAQLVADGETVQSLELVPERSAEVQERLSQLRKRDRTLEPARVGGGLNLIETPATASMAGTDGVSICATDLHQEIRGRCLRALESGDLEGAIFNAFKTVEDRIRTLSACDRDSVGVSLVSEAMSPNAPRLLLNQIKAEQEAAHALFRGAIGLFKNPRSHRFVGDADPVQAFEAIAFASLLMRLLDTATRPADTGAGTAPPAGSPPAPK